MSPKINMNKISDGHEVRICHFSINLYALRIILETSKPE